jgi:hypothetical protein
MHHHNYHRTMKFEHASAVLQLEEKNFTLTGRDVLQGLATESKSVLNNLGNDGWELVSVLPYSRGFGDTNALIAFFKRSKV